MDSKVIENCDKPRVVVVQTVGAQGAKGTLDEESRTLIAQAMAMAEKASRDAQTALATVTAKDAVLYTAQQLEKVQRKTARENIKVLETGSPSPRSHYFVIGEEVKYVAVTVDLKPNEKTRVDFPIKFNLRPFVWLAPETSMNSFQVKAVANPDGTSDHCEVTVNMYGNFAKVTVFGIGV